MKGPDLFDVMLRLHGAEHLGRNYQFVRLARMQIAGHLDYSEISRVLDTITRRTEWFSMWMAASERHRSLAHAALAGGGYASAGDGYLRSALCAHWASLYAVGIDRSTAHRSSLELYAAGAPYFEPPSERIEIDFDGDVIPGYLRLPRNVERPKVVLMIGGADTNKEELHHWGTQFTRRGLAVVPFDGPGQGELAARYGRLTMRFGSFHRSVSAVIDWLEAGDRDLDLGGIGVFGNSLGGYLALDAALRDPRIRGVICNGGFCDAASIDAWPEGVVHAFSSCLGLETTDVLAHVREHLDLTEVPTSNQPSALVVHGGREDLSDIEEARRAARTMNGALVVVEDGWHTCTNRDHLVSPLFGDWMVRSLASAKSAGCSETIMSDERGYAAALEAIGG
ncbi:MAG: alpha/beta hydrolase [Actinobacteria bacterium]|nr:alpha/beta hydrolase [Actinomycetota bacterium]